jgi:uncharacterized protein (TIGR01244 family)
MMRQIAVTLFAAGLAVGAERWHDGKKIVPEEAGKTPNTSAFGDRVHFAGQPGEDDLKLYAKRGVRTVINLRTPAEMEKLGFDEKAAVERNGMVYVHVPVQSEPPADVDIQRVMKILDGAKDAPVLMHCASSNRVGMMWSIFRARQHGLAADQALAEGKAAGMRNPALESAARQNIEAKAKK